MKNRKVIMTSVCALVLVVIALFSVRMNLIGTKNNEKKEESIVQFKTSGGPSIRIKNFEISQDKVKIGDAINVTLDADFVWYDSSYNIAPADGYKIEYYALWAKNIETGEVFYGTTEYNTSSGQIWTSHNASSGAYSAGTYQVAGLTISVQKQSDGSSSYLFLNINNSCTTSVDCDNLKYLQKTFTLVNDSVKQEAPVYEYTISLYEDTPEAFIGDKLNLRLYRIDKVDEIFMNRKDLKTMMLSYTNAADGNVVNMYVKSVNSNSPYIIIPSTATPGEYHLNYGYLTFYDDTSERCTNTETKTFSYNSSFVVKEKEIDTSKYEFSNELYDKNIASDLSKLDDDAIITINASIVPLINEEVFESIQNTHQTLIIEYETGQWVFSGTDITNPKSIDVSVLLSKLSGDSEYYDSFLKDNVTAPSAMLKFSDNGDLPGKVLIKLDSDSIDEYLMDPSSVYVYYYKEDTDELVKVAMEVQANDGFYEFYISHNSKYIVSSKEIKTKAVSKNVEMLSLNNQVNSSSNGLPIVLILAGISVVLAVVLLVVLLSKGKKTVVTPNNLQ